MNIMDQDYEASSECDHEDSDMTELPRPRARRIAGMLPTLLTLGNLLSGLAAIMLATRAQDVNLPLGLSTISAACWCIFLGMFFDGLDGTAARLTHSMSRMGEQLDSLADVVTFGAAPAVIASQIILLSPVISDIPELNTALTRLGVCIAGMYLCCAALRLARYNVEDASEEAHDGFQGLPTPAAGGAIASLLLLHQWLLEGERAFNTTTAVLTQVVMLVCAFAMVSRIAYPHVMNRLLRGRARIGKVIVLLLLMLLLPTAWQFELPLLFVGYALLGPMRGSLLRLRRRSR